MQTQLGCRYLGSVYCDKVTMGRPGGFRERKWPLRSQGTGSARQQECLVSS